MTDHEHHWSNLCDADTDCWAERDDEISPLREQLEAARQERHTDSHRLMAAMERAEAAEVEAKKLRAALQGVARVIDPGAAELCWCDDRYLEPPYEHAAYCDEARTALASTPKEPEHDCDAELERTYSGHTQARDGTVWTCSCGKRWEHVCDEAEGCQWEPSIYPRGGNDD